MSTNFEVDELGAAVPLKKSASTNETCLNLANLNLREAKSFAGNLDGTAQTQEFEPQPPFELLYKICDCETDDARYLTKDALTHEVFYIREQMMSLQKRICTLDEIAAEWKKDCRMWLWKNDASFKKNRSVANLTPKH